MFDLVGQASQYPGDFLAFLVKCLVLGVDFNFKHDNKSEKGGELGSQLLDFFVKLFNVELFVVEADPVTVYRWHASSILFEVFTSPSKLVALIVVIQPKSYVPSLVVSPTVVTHGLVYSQFIVE